MKIKYIVILSAMPVILPLAVIAGAIINSSISLPANDEEVLQYLPPHAKYYIREQRIKRHIQGIENCKDEECLLWRLRLLVGAYDTDSGTGTAPSIQLNDSAKGAIHSYLLALKEKCDQTERPHESPNCYRDKFFILNTIPLLAPESRPVVDDINKEIVRLRGIDIKNQEEQGKIRVEAEKRERIAEAEERKKREYAERYMDFTWSDNDTGELSGKAIIERSRIRKYRSIGNNDMAQAFVKMFDEWGSIVLNPSTGHEYHEIRFNCDIYESTPDVIVGGSRRYGMTGNMPKAICSEAGYRRR
jgi:hypothetical protein